MEVSAINNTQIILPPDRQDNAVSSSEVQKGQRAEEAIVSANNKEAAEDVDAQRDHEHLKKTVENINKLLESMDTSLNFYIHKESGQIAVKVINNKSKEVIREIPPEEMLRLAARMQEAAGLIIDKTI